MKVKKDLSGVFRARIANRRRSLQEHANWGVYSVKNDGNLYAKPGSSYTTKEEAEAKVALLKKLNPGKNFVAKEL